MATTAVSRRVNEVRVIGRTSAPPERRILPSGDEIVLLRVVVPRSGGRGADTLPVAVGPAPARGRPGPDQVGRRLLAQAERANPGDDIEVRGELRRRWWSAPTGRASRIEIRATSVVVVDAGSATD